MNEVAQQARRNELARGLDEVRSRLDDAARACGREPSDVGLLTVTKFFPASDAVLLYELGCRAFGESREQEAHTKIEQFRAVVPDPTVQWHMIGRLQRNKARAVARWAHTVHSVDSARLAGALATGVTAALAAGDRTEPLRVLLQVSLDGDPQRGGVTADGLDALADAVAAADGLELAGLMGVPPLGADVGESFATLAELGAQLRQQHPEARELSAGMSGDLEHAVRHGSTCVRVGTGVLGPRPLA